MKVSCLAIRGINKKDKSKVYVEWSNNKEINLIPEDWNIEIRKLSLYNSISKERIEMLNQKFEDYIFEMFAVDYEFRFNEKELITSCEGCLHFYKDRGAYSCFGCMKYVGNVWNRENYVRKK